MQSIQIAEATNQKHIRLYKRWTQIKETLTFRFTAFEFSLIVKIMSELAPSNVIGQSHQLNRAAQLLLNDQFEAIQNR